MSRVKKKDHEKLDNASLNHVIGLLNAEKPITKKEACSILNISYNTTRLNKIIKEYEERLEYEKMRRAENRKKPIDDYDKRYIIREYLRGNSIAEISKDLFRSAAQVRKTLLEYDIPLRQGKHDYTKPELLPDNSVKTDYAHGDLAWSAKYGCVVEILKEIDNVAKFYKPSYSVWIMGKYNQFGNQPYYELAYMPKLSELSIVRTDLQITDKIQMEYSIG